ncbi:ferric/cupric-chelate reductase [Podila epigama]|nr:ferric/cupric-chelate reductase [Podila epigama]
MAFSLPKINFLYVFITVCMAIPIGYGFADYDLTWHRKITSNYFYGERDYYIIFLCILPTALGHLATIWGHYFRAEREFQHSIAKVTSPASVNQKISLWERHIFWGYTVKYWILVAITVALNLTYFIVPMIQGTGRMIERFGVVGGVARMIGNASGYTVVANCGMILFLVLRRSMLHAIGFTYSEIIPLHRWLGAAIVAWSTIHTIGYVTYLGLEGRLQSDINFYDLKRGTLNMMGVFAYGAVCLLGLGAIPWVRRRYYLFFLSTHRFFTAVFFIGMVTHFPNPMLWYYLLPSIILFLVDRFVPKIIQARTVQPEVTCTFNSDADIMRLIVTSPEPMKPYYPGDYITIQIPKIGTVYHPFTIASYWPEDPYSMTLYIRTFEDSKLSWTCNLARLCGNEDKRIRVKANVDGVFGDRRHDYLNSETMIIFVAGAAITTFMALIKAIAAQIAASNEPLRMQLHLICTFRTRSELHAYGSFLHQITRDPRFTSWLHVEIFVSRPDKPQTLMGAHAHVVKNDIMVPSKSAKKEKKKRFATIKRTGTILKRALSGRTIVSSDVDNEKSPAANEKNVASSIETEETAANSKESSIRRSGSVHTVVELDDIAEESAEGAIQVVHEKAAAAQEPLSAMPPTREMTYVDQGLPTFQAAHSTTVAKHLAKLDMFATFIMIFVPLAAWCVARSVPWEGPSRWCPDTKLKGTYVSANCRWTYAMIPGVIQIIISSIAGYFGVWLARTVLLRRGRDVEKGLPYPDLAVEEDRNLSVQDGNWDEGDVVYTRGRVDVKKIIQGFVEAGVGKKEKGHGLVAVFGGGPDGFVDMIEKQTKKADWSVDFHRETWAP